ncbi:hypothetical protein [Tepidibacter thalassicus]|uniref:Phage tail assembly chaperone protein, TAC n=1 Tax=Tepidibacter thalassicus DSM 15285 TaxID=1123350 RepID=A0A1M5PVH8_9FIRM|nr:hypothetical protein [Tepidibacter thalassicus]SHH05865.1 hypothetical protein SAMN02744040_00630 [Tepidibacter thalassicus DSM 15285]
MKGKELKQVGIKIKLDKERHLLFDLNSFCELEDRFGSIQKAFEELQKGSVKGIRTLLWAGLIHEDEGLTEKEVGKMITLEKLNEVVDIISKAISDAMPNPNGDEENKEKN